MKSFLDLVSVFMVTQLMHAKESFDAMNSVYTGNVEWDAITSTVTFTSSGTINFTNKAVNWSDPYS